MWAGVSLFSPTPTPSVASGSPLLQVATNADSAHVDSLLTLGRVILDYYIVPVAQYILDTAHLAPVRGAVWQGHRYMLPAHAVAGNDSACEGLEGNQKRAVVSHCVS